MYSVAKKELHQFFSSLTGYITVILSVLINGLFLFVFKDSNIFDYGYASLDNFFNLAPWIFIVLIPALTMRTLAEEFKTGTFELLQALPLGKWQIVLGKYLAVIGIVVFVLLPTLLYVETIHSLAAGEGIDSGTMTGSYTALFLLAAVFSAIGICSSGFTGNAIVAFLISAFACLLIYFGCNAISQLPGLSGKADYYVEMIGIDFHYRSMSRGVIDTRDIIYFFSLIFFFLLLTVKTLRKKII